MQELLLPVISSHRDGAGSLLSFCVQTGDFTLGPKDAAGWDLPGASRRLAEEVPTKGLRPGRPGEPFASTESAYAFE